MFKKIKQWLQLQRAIQVEVLDTLAEICLYLKRGIDNDRDAQSKRLEHQYRCLKSLSDAIKGREYK